MGGVGKGVGGAIGDVVAEIGGNLYGGGKVSVSGGGRKIWGRIAIEGE